MFEVWCCWQEHQDTGEPLVLPQDIRLLQDHNGQRPFDVAAAFYEEVPEVWDHLKLVGSAPTIDRGDIHWCIALRGAWNIFNKIWSLRA